MLGLGSSLLQGGALRSIVRSGLQLFYKADRTQAPLGEEQVRNNSFDEISSNLVSNPTFDLGPEEVQNRSFDELGPDKVDNGSFETGISGWAPVVSGDSTVTYNSGLKGIKLTKVGSGACKTQNVNSDNVQGETYKLTYRVLENNNCTHISVWNGATYEGSTVLNVEANGEDFVYYLEFTGGGVNDLYLQNNTADSDITLSNIKLEKVDPNDNWTKRNGSTINNVANVIAGGNIGGLTAYWSLESLGDVFEPSKTYQIKFRAKQVSLAGSNAGNFQVGNSYGILFDEVITSEFVDYTFTTQVSSNNWPKLTVGGRTAGDVFQIDNVSVKEVPNWVLSSASVSNNKCTMTSVGGALTYFYQTGLSLTQNKSYKISFKATRISGDTNLAFSSFTGTNVTNSPTISQSGEYSFDFTPSSTVPNFGLKRVTGNSGAVWEIENFSVKQLDPNNRWTVGTGWVFSDNGNITHTGSAGNFESSQELVTGKKYEAIVIVASIADGSCNLFNSSNSETYDNTITEAGTHIRQFTATHATSKIALRSASSNLVVSSLSVKEITNSIKDHSRNSNDGILYSGKALALDPGTNAIDYVSLRPSNEMGISPSGFTFAIWFNADTSQTGGSDKRIFTSRRSTGGSYFAVLLTGSGHLRVYFKPSGSLESTIISTDYRDDNWHRLAISAGPTQQKIYIDGQEVGSDNIALATDPSSDVAYLGAGVTPDDATMLKCKLADFQIYDKAWNATDVKYDWENPDKDVFDRVGEAQILGHERIPYPNLNETGLTGWNTSNTSSPDYTITDTSQGVRYVNNGASSSPAHTFSINLGNNSIVSGKTYSLEVVISEFRGTGGIKFASTSVLNSYPLSSPGTINFNSDGTHTHIFTAGDNLANFSVYRNSSNVDLTIKSISIKEVTTHASHILPTDCKSLLRLNEGAGDRVYDAAPVLGEDQMESRNGSFELGAEEVVDGNFPIGTSAWLVGDKWTIANNSARLVSNTTDSSFLQQNSVFEIGKIYNLTFDATVVLGTAKFIDASGGTKLEINQTKTYNFTFEADRTDFRINRKSTDSDITIENISVKEMTTWSYVDSIELNDSGVFFNNSNDNIFQNFDYIDGATYAIGFEGTSDTGLIRYRTGFAAPAIEKLEVPIPGTAILRPDSTSQRIQIFGPSSGTATVSKVTIKEIKPAESFFITGDKNFIHQQPYIPQYAMSSFSKKAFFDGVNDYASNGTSLASISRANNYSVSLWFVPYTLPDASVDDRQGLFQNSHASTDRNGISIFPDGTIRVGHFGDIQAGAGEALNWNSASSDNSVELGKLYHVVYTNEAYTPGGSNGTKLYINGVLQSGTATAYTSATVGVYIGKNTNSGELSNALIDEVSVFSKTFSQAEVLELYNSGSSFDSTGHSKYNLGEEVSNGTFELGSEEVVNGDFATDSDWVEGLGFNISGGVMNYDGSAIQYRRANQVLNTEIGALYKLQFTLNDLSTSGVNFGFGNSDGSFSGGIAQQTYSSDGTYTRYMVATIEDHSIVIQNNSATQTFNVDNISVKKIPNWELGDGWSLVNGKASLDYVSTTEYLSQELTGLVNGRTYVISFDLDISSNGSSIGISNTGAFGDASGSDRFFSTNGRKTLTAVYNSSHQSGTKELRFVGTSGVVLTVDNVSVQEYGLSAYWRNNGADQWDDLSINSNHGTVSGSPTEIFLQEVPFFSKDSLGMFMNKPRLGGLNLNASGYVNIEDNNDLDFGTGAFTMECWVTAKYENVGSSINVILGLGGNTSQTGSAGIVSFDSNKLGGYVDSATLSANSTFTEGNWYHVVITRSSGTCKLYIDTVLQNDTETSGGSITNSNAKQIGKDTTTTRGYDGVVDDVKLYSKALTQAEIKKNYNATKGKHKN